MLDKYKEKDKWEEYIEFIKKKRNWIICIL